MIILKDINKNKSYENKYKEKFFDFILYIANDMIGAFLLNILFLKCFTKFFCS